MTTPHTSFELLDVITHVINEEDNHRLTFIPSIDEVREAVFPLDSDCALVLDGFTGHLYISCRDVEGTNLVDVVCDFFSLGMSGKDFHYSGVYSEGRPTFCFYSFAPDQFVLLSM